MKFSDGQLAGAPHLEPVLEGLLRRTSLHDDVHLAFLVQGIKNRALCVSLDSTEEETAMIVQRSFWCGRRDMFYPYKGTG